MILETRRLILRGWRDEDASSLFKYASDKRVGPAAGWLPHKDENYSRAVIRTIFAGPEIYAICYKGKEDEPIGSIGLTLEGSPERPLEEGAAELGYWVGVPFWGQGIATEASKEMIRHGFEDLSMQKIYCAYFDGNERSKKVQQKCGFTYHHTNPECKVIMLGETRIEHVNLMTFLEWENTKKT
ncbi:N-acetyltransferase [Butyrivibrio sp. CB08]|uniref:GNAT family N-acetyltransferase n=1 Tax=Butyrivibrio sp. CB08 TaxID=2364879 RepID=UPI000EAA7D53|nr:GNAT family N-acetyltransferase [Butyrivibrio sp. CB08]RKM62232.1 N-acetyltransferase [Butyrivibrio sp. CB08]